MRRVDNELQQYRGSWTGDGFMQFSLLYGLVVVSHICDVRVSWRFFVGALKAYSLGTLEQQ